MSESAAPVLNPQVRSPYNPRVMMAKNLMPLPPMPLRWNEITKILPHRHPILLVDKITELVAGHRIVGLKNVTVTEDFFQGHFPGHPVMPGVLILESMAQVAGILILVTRNTPGALSYFATIEKARFLLPVRPGDTIITEATLEVLRGPLAKVSAVGRVDGVDVVEAEFTFYTKVDAQTQTIIRESGAVALDMPQNGGVVPAATSVPAPVPVSLPAKEIVSAPPVVGRNGSAADVNIHPTAIVHDKAQLASGVKVGPYCIVEEDVSIGEGTILESHVVIKRDTVIGRNCRMFPHCVIGDEPQDAKYKGERTRVVIGDNNIFRELITVHRATGEGETTIVGNNNMIMAYVHIGHNCVIGDNNLISNSAGISGHVTIEDKCVIGGYVGIHQFVHIGKMAMLGGLSKVIQDVPPFCMADGRPARIRGLNTRGLRRNGITSEERQQISAAFKLLYRSNLNTTQAIERVREEIPSSEPLDYLTSFIERVREGRLGRQDENPL